MSMCQNAKGTRMTTPLSPSVGGRVAGAVAVVTGAAAGIGQATALLLAQEGATVIATDRDLPGAQATYDALCAAGGAGTAYALDVTEEQQWVQVLNAVVAQFGRLDLLVNNAGMSFAKDVTDMTLAEWRQVITVSLDSVFLGTSSAIRAMRQGRGGVIINIASASGLKASPGASAYCASKAAVRMFAKAVVLSCARAHIIETERY
jgi:3(or 17)beta-hydroxysteroid dehydrogenase